MCTSDGRVKWIFILENVGNLSKIILEFDLLRVLRSELSSNTETNYLYIITTYWLLPSKKGKQLA